MGYLADYHHYNRGNECPESFLTWSALTMLSTVISRKVWYSRDYFDVYPNIYVCLVGDPGSGKGFALSQVRTIIGKEHPTIPMSASVTSREDAGKFMGSVDGTRTFQDSAGTIHEYHPFFFPVSELENLLSVDLEKMTAFLVDIYDASFFSMSFKRDEKKDLIPNPCATMLANTNPKWIMSTLKMNLFEGGLGRRLILVTGERKAYIAEQKIPTGGLDAWVRVQAHLKDVEKIIGGMPMNQEARAWWIKWYEDPSWRKTDDPILRQFFSRLEIILLKMSMLFSLERYPPTLEIDLPSILAAWELLKRLEPGVKQLSLGVGRNEMAAVTVQFIDALRALGGVEMEKRLRAMFFRDCKMQGREFDGMLEHLTKTEQIVILGPGNFDPNKTVVMLPERYQTWKKEGK
jgi:hypothetical protein